MLRQPQHDIKRVSSKSDAYETKTKMSLIDLLSSISPSPLGMVPVSALLCSDKTAIDGYVQLLAVNRSISFSSGKEAPVEYLQRRVRWLTSSGIVPESCKFSKRRTSRSVETNNQNNLCASDRNVAGKGP
jgi:hypothetical protein